MGHIVERRCSVRGPDNCELVRSTKLGCDHLLQGDSECKHDSVRNAQMTLNCDALLMASTTLVFSPTKLDEA